MTHFQKHVEKFESVLNLATSVTTKKYEAITIICNLYTKHMEKQNGHHFIAMKMAATFNSGSAISELYHPWKIRSTQRKLS